MKRGAVLGIDLGGTKIACGIVQEGKVLYRIVERTEVEKGVTGILKQMRRMALACLQKRKVKGIGISAAGPIDFEKNALVRPPNLPHRGRIYLFEPFYDLKLPLRLENDANCAALAEHLYGAGRGCEDLVYLTISTGIGGGLILGGKLYRGCNGNAGELGHVIIHPGGRKCGCGARGCLEAYCSGTALEQILQEKARKYKKKLFSGVYKERTMDIKTFFDAVEQKEEFALFVVQDFIQDLALGLASIATAFNPERVVLGGGIGSRAELYMKEVERRVKSHLMLPLREPLKLKKAMLGSDIGILGAASLF